MNTDPFARLVRLHKALAHPARLRVLMLLRRGELCVCQINAVIGLAPSTMSAHLRELKEAELIAERKAGRWVHYRLVADGAARGALSAATAALGGAPEVVADAALLAAITAVPPESVTRPGFDLAALRRACCPPRLQPRPRKDDTR